MKFELTICDLDNPENSWIEEYDTQCEDARKYGEEIIESFNESLRSGEKKRKLLNVLIIDENTMKEHTWNKTNLVTIIKGGLPYDTYRCKNCSITGKRYGLSETIKKDSKYKAEVYVRCDTSEKHLKKLRNR